MKFIRDVMIPMPDGVRIAANLWLPDKGKFPALLTYLPYTKEIIGTSGDNKFAERFAEDGYAVVLADFRGTGNSEGINTAFVDPQEREDGYHIIEWIAAQEWCDGNVGMWGISYGGIVTMATASVRPPHLKAIVPISGTFDNFDYHLQPHGTQGLLIADMDLGAHMAARNLMPPILEDAEGKWLEKWQARLENNKPWILDWHGEAPEADWWQKRVIPIEQINVPTFTISGWRDIYNGVMFDVYNRVDAPSRVLMGDWKHIIPEEGYKEMRRWWDRWLKGIENGIENEPPVQIYIQGAKEWRAENEWPIARTEYQRFYLDEANTLSGSTPAADASDQYEYNPCVGAAYIAYNESRDWIPIPDDQSADDMLSLAYTSTPFDEATEITGTPIAHIFLSADAPETNLVAKLCCVKPNGKSVVLSEGRASTSRASAHDEPKPLAPDEVREIVVPLRPTAFLLQPGERLRLSLSGADFSEIWPTPQPYSMNVYRGGEYSSYCEVPVVPAPTSLLPQPALAQPPRASPRGDGKSDVVHYDVATGDVSYESRNEFTVEVEKGTSVRFCHYVVAPVEKQDPQRAGFTSRTEYFVQRPSGTLKTEVTITASHEEIHVSAVAQRDGQSCFQREWRKPAGRTHSLPLSDTD
jgi:putative CocE/NonD family hydrolase